MPTTGTGRTFPVEIERRQTPEDSNGHVHERSYRRLRKLVQAVDGFFSLILVESNFSSRERAKVLERLRSDLSESGRSVVEIELRSESKDPQVEIVSVVRGAGDHSPVIVVSGLARQQSTTRSRHDAYQILNVARDALERETPGPLIAWCTGRELSDLREHAPDFFDHFTGVVRFHIADRATPSVLSERTPDHDREDKESRVAPPRRLISLYEERLANDSLSEDGRLATTLNLAELLVELPESEALDRANDTLEAKLRQSFEEGGVADRIRRDIPLTVPVLDRQVRVPFGFQNGAFQLLQPARFLSASEASNFATACKYSIEGGSVQETPHEQLGDVRFNVIGRFNSKNDPSIPMVRRALRENSVQLYLEHELPDLIDQIRRTAKPLPS